MDITPATAVAPANPGTKPASSASALSSDFETFLRMLTVQMENQDPLNPIESSDFAVQLATFSGVEQQIRTNDLIADLATSLQVGGVARLASWVGMEARAAVPAWFGGAPVAISPEVPAGADQATLVVRDAGGRVVSREAVPPNAGELFWGGADANGAPLPEGLYSFTLESHAGGELMSVDEVPVYARIVEARLEDGEVVLVFEGGATAPDNRVSAVRSPR